MKWSEWFNKWRMTSLKVNAKFLEMEWKPVDQDRTAAWELYVELLTRVATQPLAPEQGDEKTALESVFSLFQTTRAVLQRNTWECQEFTKIAVIVLNQIIRPFTAKWHKRALDGAFSEQQGRDEFRSDMQILQGSLRTYMKMLADMAQVEDLTDLEEQA